MKELEHGTLIHGRYRIQEALGKGGMGSVYVALDESLGVQVALKENLLEEANAIEQFRREAIILAGMRHPNLPRVTDHFVIEGQGQYLVMDFIEGEDLKMRIQRVGALPEKEVVLIGAAIADALNYMHGLQPPVLHRDIKPANIRITPNGHVFLVDFGLAKQVESGQVTATGARGLTPGYSPPEQYGTGRTDGRSDIYALGATLYTALTGFPPEDGLAVAIKQTQLTSIRSRNPKVGQDVAGAVEKALKVEAADRQQSGAEFRSQLLLTSDTANRQFATGDVTVAPPPAEATVAAGDVTMPTAPETKVSDSHEAAVSAVQKKPFPFGLAAGIALVIVLVISAVIFLPGLLGGQGVETSVAFQPSASEALPAGQEPTKPLAESQAASLPTRTPASMPTGEPALTATDAPRPTATAAATPMGGGGMIAFASTRSGDPQIFLYSLESGEVTQLTEINGGACQPEWSNDGQRLVFIAPCKQNQQSYPGSSLFIINADGTHMNPLPSSPIGDFDPSWSPQDNRIVFTSIRDFDRPQVWVLDVDSGESVNLSQNSQADYQPTWSSDGSKILFASNRVVGRAKLWVMDADGQNVVEFSHSDNRTNIEPSWSPDGNQIVYTQFDSRGRGVPVLMGNNWRDGGPEAGMVEFRISDEPSGMREADFSPDGLWIVFANNSDPSNLDIYIMRSNGADLSGLIVSDSNDFDPAWKP